MRPLLTLLLAIGLGLSPLAGARPDTGISGVYEVVVGTRDAAPLIDYFRQFGFRETAREQLGAAQARQLYDVDSKALSIRMQNGGIDSHGLLRIVQWGAGLGPGGRRRKLLPTT